MLEWNIIVVDSYEDMHGNNKSHLKMAADTLVSLLYFKYPWDEIFLDKRIGLFVPCSPQQNDAYNCGLFTIASALMIFQDNWSFGKKWYNSTKLIKTIRDEIQSTVEEGKKAAEDQDVGRDSEIEDDDLQIEEQQQTKVRATSEKVSWLFSFGLFFAVILTLKTGIL